MSASQSPCAYHCILWRFEENKSQPAPEFELSWGIGAGYPGEPMAVDNALAKSLETGWSAYELVLEDWAEDLGTSWHAAEFDGNWTAGVPITSWHAAEFSLEA